jgi:hypothetical protein
MVERNSSNENVLSYLRDKCVNIAINWYRDLIPKGNLKYEIPKIKIEGYKILSFKDRSLCIGVGVD